LYGSTNISDVSDVLLQQNIYVLIMCIKIEDLNAKKISFHTAYTILSSKGNIFIAGISNVTIRPALGGTVPLLGSLSHCPQRGQKSPAFRLSVPLSPSEDEKVPLSKKKPNDNVL